MERRSEAGDCGGGFAPGAVVADVARQADVGSAQIYRWRQELRNASSGFAEAVAALAAPGLAETGEPALDVLMGADIRVRIPASVPAELAAAVIGALARR